MHYFHSREESAEILRRALQLMAPHKAAFHPLSYALWYEHAADLNPGLSRDLEKYSVPRAPLCEPDVSRLYALHIAARDVEAFARAQSQLRALLEDTASGAASAQTATVRLTHSLDSVRNKLELEQAVDAATLKRLVADLLNQAQMMQKVAVEFSEKLTTHRTEVMGVVERLERAQTEPLRDPLTGLNNRHGFQRAADVFTTPNLNGVTLLAADVDHFKKINDTHGHVIGDKVLLKIAEILRTHLKAEDVASRLGGDEFAVLLPGMSLSEAAELAEQIRGCVSRTLISRSDGAEYAGQVSLSIGLAVGEANDTLETLRHRADAAMYKAKDAGRNRVSLWPQPGLHSASATSTNQVF